MPHSHYVPGHEPPSFGDRILAHAMTVPLALLTFVFGVMILASIVTPIEVSRSLSEADPFVVGAVAAPLVAGSPAVIWGALNPGWRLRPLTAMAIEQAGVIAVAGGSAAFSLGVLFSGNTLAIGTMVVTFGVVAAFALRAFALRLMQKRVRARQEADAHGGQ